MPKLKLRNNLPFMHNSSLFVKQSFQPKTGSPQPLDQKVIEGEKFPLLQINIHHRTSGPGEINSGQIRLKYGRKKGMRRNTE
jgi:hypothetical protein